MHADDFKIGFIFFTIFNWRIIDIKKLICIHLDNWSRKKIRQSSSTERREPKRQHKWGVGGPTGRGRRDEWWGTRYRDSIKSQLAGSAQRTQEEGGRYLLTG